MSYNILRQTTVAWESVENSKQCRLPIRAKKTLVSKSFSKWFIDGAIEIWGNRPHFWIVEYYTHNDLDGRCHKNTLVWLQHESISAFNFALIWCKKIITRKIWIQMKKLNEGNMTFIIENFYNYIIKIYLYQLTRWSCNLM